MEDVVGKVLGYSLGFLSVGTNFVGGLAIGGSDIGVIPRLDRGFKMWSVLWESWREEVLHFEPSLAFCCGFRPLGGLGVILARDWRRLLLRGTSGVGYG